MGTTARRSRATVTPRTNLKGLNWLGAGVSYRRGAAKSRLRPLRRARGDGKVLVNDQPCLAPLFQNRRVAQVQMVSAAIFFGEVAVQNGGGPGEVAGTMRPQVFAREPQRAIGGKGLRNFRRDFRPAGVFHRGDIEKDQAGIFGIKRRRL